MAVLQDAKLVRTVLIGANVREARLSGSNLHGTKLNCAQGLAGKQLSSACGDADTVLLGDGKIYVSALDQAVWITTGKRGDPAV